ncbi:MAG TPA: WbuC family cupin fold metalloprotein [Bacteroidales bacterium]|nr:WbuC family cupin fold metalloprotein [Bacteroidales bacterium]
MQVIDNALLDRISDEAKLSSRLRMNFNFHSSADSPSQRMLNALEPGTLLPIHRHPATQETYVLLRGRIRVLFYNADGTVSEDLILDPLQGLYGVNIPAGQWHNIEVLEPGSTIFECKDGPYEPLGAADLL